MPVATELTIPTTNVERGDYIIFPDHHPRKGNLVVHGVNRGNKYVTVTNADGGVLIRRERQAQLTVKRYLPTDEEIAAKKAERAAEEREFWSGQVQSWVTNAIARWAGYVSEQAAAITERPGDTYHNPIANLLEGGAQVRIAKRIYQIYTHLVEKDESVTWADAWDAWKTDATETLINGVGFSQSALSRSTSVIENLNNDVYIAAIREMLSDRYLATSPF